MTICIAAIAKENDSEYIVFSTDHMVTTYLGQFEHSIIKYVELNKNTIAMLAGQVLLFDDLVKLSDGNGSYEQINNEIFNNFKTKREEIPNEFIHTILSEVAEFKLETQILLIGFVDSLAQITNIGDSGITNFRSMNFHAIGSGAVQAMNTLLFQKHSKADLLFPTIYNVYKAKKNAEVSEGVGKETEMLVLGEGGVQQLSSDDLVILDKIYMEELQYGKNSSELSKMGVEVG